MTYHFTIITRKKTLSYKAVSEREAKHKRKQVLANVSDIISVSPILPLNRPKRYIPTLEELANYPLGRD